MGLIRNSGDLVSGDGQGADVPGTQGGTTEPPAPHRAQKVRGETHLQLRAYTSSLLVHTWSSLHGEIRMALSTAMIHKHVKRSTWFPCKSLHLYTPGMLQSEAGSRTGGGAGAAVTATPSDDSAVRQPKTASHITLVGIKR